MTKESRDFSGIRKLLSQRRDELVAKVLTKQDDLRNFNSEDKTRSGNVGEYEVIDQSVTIGETSREVSLLEMKNKDIQRYNNALYRLDCGEYGNCQDCGEEISEKRLKAIPFAERCVRCQEKYETELAQERRSRLDHQILFDLED